jgi:tryptophanyl-tRNA synthetase
MSKSLGNTIDILAGRRVIRKQVMSMVTDTKRILRTTRAGPRSATSASSTALRRRLREIWDGERTARTGCVDTKTPARRPDRRPLRRGRERYAELMADPAASTGS